MDIGKTKRVITIEPVKDPVPHRRPATRPSRQPEKAPAPARREREKVPA